MVPSHPFELLIYYKDGKMPTHTFQTIGTAQAAAEALKPAIVAGYKLSVVLESKALHPMKRG